MDSAGPTQLLESLSSPSSRVRVRLINLPIHAENRA